MRITISSSGGISRQLHLASVFDASGDLHRLLVPFYSGKHRLLARYVRGRQDPQAIDATRVSTDVAAAAYRKLLMKTPLGSIPGIDAEVGWRRAVGRRAARRLPVDTQVLLAESMVSLEVLARARGLGIPTVLDRTNSHIVTQQELVRREYAEQGLGSRGAWRSEAAVGRGVAEYDLADRIVVLSSFARRTFLERGFDPARVIAVPPGVDLTGFTPRAAADDVFRVIYVGLSCLRKGTHHLLEAFASARMDGAELWLVGGMADEVRPHAALYPDGVVHKGYVPHAGLAEVLAGGTVLVLPSVEDGFGKVILEAMACGLPVIASTNTGGPDAVRDGFDGYIVPIREPDVLSARLRVLYEDRDLARRMGASARERVMHGFSWQDYAARMRAVLDDAARAHRP